MQQAQVTPPATTVNVSIAPTSQVQFFSIDYINAINGSAGPLGAQQEVLKKIQLRTTIIEIGPLSNSNTEQTFAVEATVISEFAAELQADIRTMGTFDGVNVSSATVTMKNLIIPV